MGSGNEMVQKIYRVREGYNKIAPYYDTWYWQTFWKDNEGPKIEKWCVQYLAPGVGADLGAGSGNNLLKFLQIGHSVDAYDISDKMLDLCRNKYCDYLKTGKLHCYESDIERIYPYERKYDWILSNRVLSHIEDVQGFVRKVAQIIKYGGQCFISDVHPLRHYQYTHFKIENEDVMIETYRHPVELVKKCFVMNNFEILKFKEVNSNETINSEKIRLDDSPIFYYFILKYKGIQGAK